MSVPSALVVEELLARSAGRERFVVQADASNTMRGLCRMGDSNGPAPFAAGLLVTCGNDAAISAVNQKVADPSCLKFFRKLIQGISFSDCTKID